MTFIPNARRLARPGGADESVLSGGVLTLDALHDEVGLTYRQWNIDDQEGGTRQVVEQLRRGAQARAAVRRARLLLRVRRRGAVSDRGRELRLPALRRRGRRERGDHRSARAEGWPR